MRIPLISSALLIGASLAAPAPPNASDPALGQLQDLMTQALETHGVESDALSGGVAATGPKCTRKTMTIRRPWGKLSKPQRKAYTDAVRCLQKLPARTPRDLVPGVRSRYDDFVATHINQTSTIHYTGSFLAWHRWFTYQYEQALRNECGYRGAQPYWNWALYASDPASSPIFDGSDSSMSGNGEFIPDKGPLERILGNLPKIYLPAGTGGGCVTSGPFKDMKVNLGPVSMPLNNGTRLTGSGLEYNPRCLKRDLSAQINSAYANATSVLDLLLRNDNIEDFELEMQGVPGGGSIGVHGGGHYTIAGDPGADAFASPGDPAFYLHHGMVDLVWLTWQLLDLGRRRDAVAGTGTFLNSPPSPPTTLDDVVDLYFAGGGPVRMRDLMSTADGPFCYTYST